MALVEGLEEWSDSDENTALLIDYLHYWLVAVYRQWVADPNDPEVIAAREEQQRLRRAGVRPADMPVVEPVARRPLRAHVERLAKVQEQVAESNRKIAAAAQESIASVVGSTERKEDGRIKVSISQLKAIRSSG